jgi:hypothetical protein
MLKRLSGWLERRRRARRWPHVATARGRALDLIAEDLLNERRAGFWERVPLLGNRLFRRRLMGAWPTLAAHRKGG